MSAVPGPTPPAAGGPAQPRTAGTGTSRPGGTRPGTRCPGTTRPVTARLPERWREDSGSLLLVIVGYALIAMALVVVAVDASALFLTKRGLSAVADGAAVAGAQALDTPAIYSGVDTPDLPLDNAGVQQAVSTYLAGSALDASYPTLRVLAAATDGQQVTVTLQEDKRLPFAALFAGVPGPLAGGIVHVQATAQARAPFQ